MSQRLIIKIIKPVQKDVSLIIQLEEHSSGKLKTIVGDDEARLEETLRDALRRSDLVITTGGLGPTEDDITRQCSARAIDRPLVFHDEIESHLRERFRA